MPNTTIELRSSGSTGNTPSLGVLANGELAINRADGILYYKSSSNTLGSIRTTQPAGLTTEIQFNDSGSFGSNTGLTFNKSTGYFKAPIIESTNNGNGTNFKVGDDAWIGDVNSADTLRISGQQNSANAYIIFGSSDTTKLGRAGTGALTYGGAFTATGTVSGNELTSTQSAGDEGGQVNLSIPQTNTSLTGQVTIDVYQNKLRFFQGDSAKGAYIDLTAAAAGVGSNLLSGGGGGTTDFGFGQIFTSNNSVYANAASANDKVTFVGESGTVVYANATSKTITFAGTPGAQGLTVDYGFVNDPIYYSIDYGSLA